MADDDNFTAINASPEQSFKKPLQRQKTKKEIQQEKKKKQNMLKQSAVEMKSRLNSLFFGQDYNRYNTVGETACCCNFVFMQILRMLGLLVLFVVFCAYMFIYMRIAIYQYIFWGLFFTFLAFVFLFIGAGKQVVYQKLVKRGKIKFENPKQKTYLWKLGVLFYTLAFPNVILANITYFVSF
jgi:hypothetical protein